MTNDKPFSERQEFLGIHFDMISANFLMESILTRNPNASFEYVVTPNVDHIVKLHQRASRLDLPYHDAAFTICDSRILPLLARINGIRIPVIPGSDLTARLFQDVIAPDDPVTIVGSGPEEIERLKCRYGLKRVRHHSPPMNLVNDPVAVQNVVEFIVSSPARYIFLALGSPQQEVIAHQIWLTGEGRGLGFCVGASIDFLTGKATRAPRFVQRLRLEWLYRLIKEPGRLWRRYLIDDIRILAIYWRWLLNRKSK